MMIKKITTSYLAILLVFIYSIATAEISFEKIDSVKIWNYYSKRKYPNSLDLL